MAREISKKYIRICSAPEKNIIMRYTKIILSPNRDRTQGRPSVLKLVSRSFCVQQSDFHFLVAVCEVSSEVRVLDRSLLVAGVVDLDFW